MQSPKNNQIFALMDALAERTRSFLESEIPLAVMDVKCIRKPIHNLKLSYLTSLVSVNSSFNMFLSFSFEKEVIFSILEAFTQGLAYPEEEESLYLEESAAELLNIVVGNTADRFAPDGEVVAFSPPIVISEAKSILKNNQAEFYAVEMNTAAGMLYIYIIGPKHLFDEGLNYLEEGPMDGMDVMIVDDSLIAVRKLSQLLENLGYRVVGTCKTGEEACRMFAELKPDLVSMDINMPDMDGITVTREILSQDPKALVIMVTSHGQEQMVIDAIEAGAKGYILKPFSRDKVSETIEKVRKKYCG